MRYRVSYKALGDRPPLRLVLTLPPGSQTASSRVRLWLRGSVRVRRDGLSLR